MSVSERNSTPDTDAFLELQQLVRHLVDELAGFRRRALQAEAKLRQLDGAGSAASSPRLAAQASTGESAGDGDLAALEAENARLRARLDQATDRTRKMLDRVRFLRQQHLIAGGGEK